MANVKNEADVLHVFVLFVCLVAILKKVSGSNKVNLVLFVSLKMYTYVIK